ncbi:PucR family transcriptional regulator ligand-binding domain-containing protein [Streptomyces sp. NBC_00328]|uniref:PucR family transcriptional regulator ligand-binding domain-containing protein n=1 Tax=Streptomyces sp. NBC_00328 TaxID=2903646 RepID=UPI002E2C47A7|nr:PucR family transcriptional regulator ligand-binding domain-containing protein [Streptomyces sp. NBC_00328]
MEELSIVPDSPPPSVPAVSVPAVPPTPPVPLSALLAREDLALRLIAGPAEPDTVIHWAHTSEMADPYPYLLGGELLLTAGVHVPAAPGPGEDTPGPEDYFDGYVSRIVAAGGAALGFGLAPVHDTVPPALVAACDTYGLPLLEVPPRTTFSGVARAVWQLMAQARLAELRRVTEAQQSLAAAAARPDPVPAVLRQLARRVNGWAVLYGPEGTELARAGTVPPPRPAPAAPAPHPTPVNPAPAPPGNLAPPGSPTASARPAPTDPAGPGIPATPDSPTARAVPPTPDSPETPGSPTAPADPASPATPGNPAAPGSPAAPADPAARGRPGREGSPEDVLGELAGVVRPRKAQGPAPASATDTVGGVHLTAYALGSGQGFVLGVASPRRDPGDHTIASVASVLLSLLTGEHQSASGAARSAALVRLLLGAAPEAVAPLLGGDQWVVVHARPAGDGPAPDAVSASALAAALGSALVDVGGDVVRVLVPGDRVPAAQPGWTCGISAPASPRGWAAADTQAARALARARATRAALVRHGDRPALADLVPPADAEAHAQALLAPVAGTPALTETLRTWLSLHGSWDRTAVALSVHRNTVRQRIARCAALLDTDLDDPNVRMELWFALREDGTRGAPDGPAARTPE